MTELQASSNTAKYELTSADWRKSDQHVLTKMEALIEALKSGKVDADTILPELEIGWDAAIHIFGKTGDHRCQPEVVSTWLSLLVTLASSKEVTGKSIACSFAKGCGGCMVYTVLNAVGCFHSQQNVKLAFDFFRHVLADFDGKILELDELRKLSSTLVSVRTRGADVTKRSVCLAIHCSNYMDERQRATSEALSNLVEGLGVLCTSESFVHDMKTNPASTIEILKQSIMNNQFSEEFARAKW